MGLSQIMLQVVRMSESMEYVQDLKKCENLEEDDNLEEDWEPKVASYSIRTLQPLNVMIVMQRNKVLVQFAKLQGRRMG
ncbi:hypothetical protein Dimus_010320 [Dionaea muscipula]